MRDVLSALIVLIAASVLAGWFWHIEQLKTVLPGLTTMKANTAIGLMAGGVSVASIDRMSRWVRAAGVAGAGLIGLIGLLTLAEYVTGTRIGIDELIVLDPDTTSRPFNGRLSPATALAFAASGASLIILSLAHSRRAITTAHVLAAIPAATGLLALTGYAYGVERLYNFGAYVSVALHTGFALSLLAAAILLTRSAEGWKRSFLDRPIALAALLRISLISLLVPLLTGLLVVWGTREGFYQAEYSPAVFAIAAAGALIWLAFQSATVLASSEAAVLAAHVQAEQINQQLHLALSSGRGVGTWDWDVVRDRVFADERFARLYGVDPQRAREGAPIAEFFGGIHPEDLPGIREAVNLALRTGGPFSAEYRLVREGSDICWVQAEGQCRLAKDGSPERFPGIAFDITDRKAAEARQAALLALNDMLRDLTDPQEIAFAASRLLGETLRVSRVGYGIVDKAAETITIERDWTAPAISSLAGVLQFRDYGSYIDDLKRGETVVCADVYLDPRTRDKAAALEALSAQSFVNMPLVEQGGFVALLFVSNAVARTWSEAELLLLREVAERVRIATERARSETALRQSEAQFRVFTQAVPNHIWAARPDGYLDWFNDQIYAYCGEPPGSLDGITPWTRIVHPDDFVAAGAAWSHSLSTGLVYETEFRIRRADGAYLWFLVRAEPVRAVDGSIARWVGTNTDIDERKRHAAQLATLADTLEEQVATRTRELMAMEETLRQSQKMEAVGQLTGGLAHDFNNLLTGISGSLELLQARVMQGRISEVDRYVAAAQGAARRATALTHRLLAFSRRQTLDPRPTDVNRLVAGMEELVRRTVGPAIAVETVASGGLWNTLIDPGQLENALLNLCINARDAMPDRGRLTIETCNRWLDERAARERELSAGQYVSLCVSDNGVGMPPDVIARAFDPFFTTKPIGAGTGLGLSMVYGFVRQSGGHARIYSEVGQGTMVCLYLPRHLGEAETTEGKPEFTEAPRGQSGETVLVVDDEPSVRMLVTDVLEELGYIAIEAADGAAGLRMLQSGMRIDLLVTDVGLPGGINGRQVADAGRTLRPGLKVLFITGYAENAVLNHGHLEAGMHVLTKPFAMQVLAVRIKDLIAPGHA